MPKQLSTLIFVIFVIQGLVGILLVAAQRGTDPMKQKNEGFFHCCSVKLGSSLPDGALHAICNYTALALNPPQSPERALLALFSAVGPPQQRGKNSFPPMNHQQANDYIKCMGDSQNNTECCKGGRLR
jgi:hypothetical protein